MESRLRSDIEAMLQRARIPGCAIASTNAAGRQDTLYLGAASLQPRRPVTAQSRFHLFSGTKVYTAAAMMLLVERGKLSLDDPIAKHLPELPLRHAVTLRQLASHDSGLPETLSAFLAVHPGDQPAPSTAQALARYRVDRGRQSGTGARYRNVNYAILGELISRVSGQSYDTFVEQALLAPLGAKLRFEHDPALRSDTAVGYQPRWAPIRLALPLLVPQASSWIVGKAVEGFVELRTFALDTLAIGGLIGPATAFLPLLREMLSDADGVLSQDSKREMLSEQSRGAAGIVSRDGVGLGWKLGHTDVRFYNHEGGGPGFCSETRLYPSHDLGIVILMNRSQSRGLSRLCHQICEQLRGAPGAQR